jgi:hypothetical protein
MLITYAILLPRRQDAILSFFSPFLREPASKRSQECDKISSSFSFLQKVISIQLQRERGKEEVENNPSHPEPTYSSSGGGVTGGT